MQTLLIKSNLKGGWILAVSQTLLFNGGFYRFHKTINNSEGFKKYVTKIRVGRRFLSKTYQRIG